jgi:hypothetical protein
VHRAGRDDDAVARADVALGAVDADAPGAGGEEVQLLAAAMEVLGGGAALGDGGLGERLVA